jgi:1-deoxy-D-xylulose-5-phosphate reductoisomerase
VDKLVEQAREFKPEVVCIADETLYEPLKEKLSAIRFQGKVWAGSDAIAEVVTMPSIDIVVASMVGYAGLKPTIEAIKAGKAIALANKETLVVAGEIICELAQQYHTPILPVDSEHSAIFQSLVGEDRSEIEKILLTASGGPFRNYSLEQMATVTAADALKHPNWDMGAKITIDSASMMNKGFEVIEAKWLFGVPVEKIQVLVHPQSIVHSAVQFTDGAIKAQLGAPDMRLPIQYALSFPERLASDFPRADLLSLGNLTFEKPDLNRFPNLGLAYEAMSRGGNMPCVLNAANEVVNLAFREGRCGFLQMSDIISETMNKAAFIAKPTYEDYVATDSSARKIAEEMLQ